MIGWFIKFSVQRRQLKYISNKISALLQSIPFKFFTVCKELENLIYAFWMFVLTEYMFYILTFIFPHILSFKIVIFCLMLRISYLLGLYFLRFVLVLCRFYPIFKRKLEDLKSWILINGFKHYYTRSIIIIICKAVNQFMAEA